jgi:translation initiation factor 3 subunit F
MYSFHRRNNRSEVVVGWYTTTTSQGQFINDNSSLIHDFYTSECERPVHIVVDTTLSGSSMDVRGFVGRRLMVGGQILANAFLETGVQVVTSEAEATCLYRMINNQENVAQPWQDSSIVSTLPTSSETVDSAILSLQKVLDNAQTYVDAVVEGNAKVPVSRDIGIALADTLNSFAAQRASSQSQAALQTRMQDLLMVSYMNSLSQTQILIAEKLNEIL